MVRVGHAAVLVLALLACAWFVLGIRQAHELASAASIVSQQRPPTAAQARTAGSQLRSAAELNPDLEVDVLRGRLALARGNPPAARRILESVTRREPQNLEAWLWLARASAGAPATFQLAVARFHQLLPHVRPTR
jgi:predicted Zn-dependent protease